MARYLIVFVLIILFQSEGVVRHDMYVYHDTRRCNSPNLLELPWHHGFWLLWRVPIETSDLQL